jgi:hypothetical protein
VTNQQKALYETLLEYGPCSSLHLAGLMRREHPGRAWQVETVRKVLAQLKYRSLVEYDVCWKALRDY